MEVITSYQQLKVYQKAFTMAATLHKLSLGFPKIEQYALADQIRRASKSICANIAEGYAKKLLSVPEFRRFLAMAFGSSEEMMVWLDFCLELGYLDTKSHAEFRDAYTQISKMLRSLIAKWSKPQSASLPVN